VPFDSVDQMRAFAYEDQLVLFTSQHSEPRAQVALLDTEALLAGRQDFVTASISKPAQ
jgi:hypothetical protein